MGKYGNKKGRPFKTFATGLDRNRDRYKRLRTNRFKNPKREMFSKRDKPKLETEAGAQLFGDYEQRRSGSTRGGE